MLYSQGIFGGSTCSLRVASTGQRIPQCLDLLGLAHIPQTEFEYHNKAEFAVWIHTYT